MDRKALLHIPMSQYAHGVDDEHIVFRLRAAKGDLRAAVLYYGDRSCRNTPIDFFAAPMEPVAEDMLFTWYEVRLRSPFMRVCYYFELTDMAGEKLLYYGDQFATQRVIDRSEYFQLPYNHRADRAAPPEWMRDAAVYNIFPDSFATGREHISCVPTEYTWQGETVRGQVGGTLRGVTENLDYIQSLGFTCVYLNPIFAAGEYHKYDLIDYHHIDPAFGTDEDFRELVQALHRRGMRIIIDGVFNHCGWRFFAFQDCVKNGSRSRYWHWFHRLTEPVEVPSTEEAYPNYECFGYERKMPKLATDHPDVRDYFCEVGAYWAREYDIDAWRLDVASEVSDGFWRAFRQAVRAVKPDCALIGEVWESAGHWLDGSMFDSAMNYDFRRHAKRFFAEKSISAQQYDARVTDMRMRYREPYLYTQLNLLDSHDVSRFLTVCGGEKRSHRLAMVMQLTFPGMPCVFYGDERGVEGEKEVEYRAPMPWQGGDGETEALCRALLSLRNAEPALRRGDYRCLLAEEDGGLYVFSRSYGGETITVAINRNDAPRAVTVGEPLLHSGFEGGMLAPYGFVISKG